MPAEDWFPWDWTGDEDDERCGSVQCRHCGFVGVWNVVGGRWRIVYPLEVRTPHRCGPTAEDEFGADPLNTP